MEACWPVLAESYGGHGGTKLTLLYFTEKNS